MRIEHNTEEETLSRRMFVASAVGVAAGARLLVEADKAEAQAPAQVNVQTATGPAGGKEPEWRNRNPAMEYARLGRTNFMMSRLAYGGGGINAENSRILQKAISQGINYIDTARVYGDSEAGVAKAIKGKRDKVWITSKAGHITGFPSSGIQQGEGPKGAKMFNEQLETSLKTLGTDYIDCYFLHGINEPWKTRIEELKDAADKAKKAGKIRFFGFSVHDKVVEVMQAGLEVGWYDVIMPAVNPANLAQVQPLLDLAKQKDVGVVGMKTVGDIGDDAAKQIFGDLYEKLAGLNRFQRSYLYMLAKAHYPGFLITAKSMEMLEDNLKILSVKLAKAEVDALEKLVLREAQRSCRMCGTCTKTCPHGVQVSQLVRLESYRSRYGEPDLARQLYAELPTPGRGAQCLKCRQCLADCPQGLDVRKLSGRAHTMLG